ncbi:MAG: metallophosphoesterase family protein [Elainellaceae cyanobacterium]
MRIRRFFWLIASLVLCLTLSCGPRGQDSPTVETPPAAEMAPESPQSLDDQPRPQASSLPPETEAIASSVAGGLHSPPRGDLRLAVISDLNGVYGATDYDPEVDKAIALLPFWAPDMVVCSGDMVAGQSPTLTAEEIRAMWGAFDAHVAAPLRQAGLPYGFTIGNHDASSARGVQDSFLFQQERDLAAEYWNDPAHDPGITFSDRHKFPFYYSFTFEDIFFLAWDGSSSYIPEADLAWVEQALSSPEAQNAKLRILLGHLPLYAVAIGRDSPGEVMENADALRAMLEEYNVHTYISGHHHAYYPAHRGDLQLLHMGILGSGPRPLIAGDLPPWKALTIIDIAFDSPELTTYTTYDMETLALIDPEQLPRFLVGHNGMVLRRDVAWEDLDASEQSACLQQHGEACGP